MGENITPEAKKSSHNTLAKLILTITSGILSFFFIEILLINAVVWNFFRLFTEKGKSEDVVEEKKKDFGYDDIKNLRITKDLRYYVLQNGLELEEYQIITEDGYELALHHLINPKESTEDREHKKPVLLQHGLLSSSGAYLTPGRGSIPYLLLQEGFDVWLGNNRSGFEPKHSFFEGNLLHNEKYWDWDVRDLAYFDLPSIIDNVLSHKPSHTKLTVIGHLQGCTQTYLMLKNPDLRATQEKVELFIQLAPAIFPGSLFHKRAFLKFMHGMSRSGFFYFFGSGAWLHTLTRMRNWFGEWFFYRMIFYAMFKYLFGWTSKRWPQSKRLFHVNFLFNVTLVSSKLLNWWVSEWRLDGFSNELLPKEAFTTQLNFKADSVYEQHLDKSRYKPYFPYKINWFGNPENDIVVPMVIFSANADYLVDGSRLIAHMQYYEKSYREGSNLAVYEIDGYHHMDVLWAADLYNTIVKYAVRHMNDIKDKEDSASLSSRLIKTQGGRGIISEDVES